MKERRSIARKIRRAITRNGLIILFILCIVSLLGKYILIKHIDQTNSIPLSNRILANELLTIYEQQLFRWTAAPFLPTYQNYRLKFKFNIISIATHLYGNFNGLNRHLQVRCFAKYSNSTAFREVSSFNLYFSVNTIDDKRVRLTLEDSSMPLANQQFNTIEMEVNRTFPIDAIFSFTYQWMDSTRMNSFDWPVWPLQKPCIDSIESRIRQSASNLDDPCLMTNTLTHLTARQMFLAERRGVLYWLDKQHAAAQFEHPLLSQTKKRRPSPMESSLDPAICTPEFNRWIFSYQQWHENTVTILSHLPMPFEQQRDRILELNIRFMIYETPSTGVADRMVHLMTTYLIAILTKRLLIFDPNWPTFSEVMQSPLNHDQLSVIPWYSHLHTLNANLSQNNSKYIPIRRHATSFDNINEYYDYDRDFPERILVFQGNMGRIVQMMISNASIYRTFLIDELHMSPENMFGCLYHSFLIHRLAPLVKRTSATMNSSSHNETLGHSSQHILRAMLSPIFYPLGIQIRTHDHLFNVDIYDQSQGAAREKMWNTLFQHYIYCAWNFLRQNQERLDRSRQLPVGFLLSNVIGIRQTFLKRWQFPPYCLASFEKGCYNRTHGLYLLANPDIVYHVSKTSQNALALQIAMFDIFLFSLCETHIISRISGFGRVAVFASLKGRKIYSLDRDTTLLCQNDSTAISLIDSGYDWSGI